MASIGKQLTSLIIALTVASILLANVLVDQINALDSGANQLPNMTTETQSLYDIIGLIIVLAILLAILGAAVAAAKGLI